MQNTKSILIFIDKNDGMLQITRNPDKARRGETQSRRYPLFIKVTVRHILSRWQKRYVSPRIVDATSSVAHARVTK